MQIEIENLQRQLQTVTYDRENAIQENRRIQDDLAAATCEVRNLERELETSRAQSFDLKRQLQTYVSEVRRAEELLNRKENERTEMLNHFRSLSLEATVLENNNHSLESKAAEARGALQTATDRMLDLERQLADRESLIRSYETQISDLTQNVASMETQLRQQGEQRHRIEADLIAVRDLCMKLDQQKDTLMHELDDKDSLKSQYDMQIAKLKAEQSVIQDQMIKDRATVEHLEMLLDQARQESITVQTNNQELQNEMSRLRQKMSELQNKLSSESSKLRQYQNQAAEYCKQISELRRQVTNERFDRARKEEENRRCSQDPLDSFAQTPLPNNQNFNESNDTKHRYLQSETSKEYDGLLERSMMVISTGVLQSRSLNEENNGKYDNQTKDAQHDVPCINIIVQPDSKMHSSQSNYVQKESIQNENTPMLPNNEDSMKTDLKALDMSQFNSFNKKYDNTACNTENCFNISQLKLWQNRGEYNQDLGQTTMLRGNTTKALDVPLKELPLKNFPMKKLQSSIREDESNKVSRKTKEDESFNLKTTNETEDFTNIPKTYLKSTSENSANLMETNLKLKSKNTLPNSKFRTIENSIKFASCRTSKNWMKSSKFVNTFCTNQIHKYMNNYETHSVPRNHGNDTPPIIPFRTTKLTNLLIQKNSDFCTDTNCNNTNCTVLSNQQKDEYCNTTTNIQFMKSERDFHDNECENKCISTIDSALDILQNMLEGVKKFKNKDTTESKVQSYANKEMRCKNKACNYVNARNEKATSKLNYNSLNATELMRPECMKMLQEIKKHTETLEEQLIVMNKNMRAKRKANEKSVTISENSKTKQQRDIITQIPEKKNIYVQKPCSIGSYVKCPQSRQLKSGYNSDYVKNKYITIQEISEKNIHKKNVKDKSYKNCNAKSQILHSTDNSRDVKNIQCQCEKSSSFHNFSTTDFLPFATSTPKTLNLLQHKKSICYISNCTQTDAMLKDNLPVIQNKKTVSNGLSHVVEKKNKAIDLISVNDEQKSLASNEDFVTILLLTKGVNNKYLKSKYKKLEFLSFRPKCIINSHILCDQRSIRCRLPRRKVQIPIVFKSKSVRCKTEDCRANRNNHMQFVEHSPNNCNDLVTTVCTQSSNLKITTATSIPCICRIDKNIVENYTKESTTEKEACILS
ncbi:Centrosomal protein of 135 kDa [Habropoda laboriosa]|uniref:Centrosomal protein of 135 kDa n=1 Tax=Habropoda laboriosa TaxID=597456 RepID=A0A0L7R627_9HYME|nr:Centrosomal protein of 135 kDa [Habropoda laboriosa]